MHRIIGLLPGREMALRVAAIGRRDRQIVIVVDVAGGARHIRVALSERESRLAVKEIRCQPARGGVTIVAICDGEFRAGGGMHGVGRLLPGGQMAL